MTSRLCAASVLLCLFSIVPAAARKGVNSESAPPVAWQQIGATGVAWEPVLQFESVTLVVTGSQGLVFEGEYPAGVPLYFDLLDLEGNPLPDGTYTFELTGKPFLSSSLRAELEPAREAGQIVSVPQGNFVQSGVFTISHGSIVDPDLSEPAEGWKGVPASPRSDLTAKDQVINDDLIVRGSACVGLDCVNGEIFSFDTLRLKENNLRIHFEDTSTVSGFPTNDWEITANDSNSGGLSHLSFFDRSSSRRVFGVQAGARANALWVNNNSKVGIGTATPLLDLHVKTGNSPALRLEQDGSSGFTAQTWDLAGNEANFFVRDVTNGSKLPFRIVPNAPGNSVFIASDGRVGVGTATPTAKLNVVGGNVHVLGANNTIAQLEVISQGTSQNAQLFLRSTGEHWFFAAAPGGTFTISRVGTGVSEVSIAPNGNMTLIGTLTAAMKPFRIDHPLDPENKYLYHSAVESPDMMNLYNGNVELDEKGEAWVELPAWFEALNKDFRYQLTPIGSAAPGLYIAREISGNRFQIAGAKAGTFVSWQVSGVRHDRYAQAYPLKVEEDKPLEQRGTFLNPELFQDYKPLKRAAVADEGEQAPEQVVANKNAEIQHLRLENELLLSQLKSLIERVSALEKAAAIKAEEE